MTRFILLAVALLVASCSSDDGAADPPDVPPGDDGAVADAGPDAAPDAVPPTTHVTTLVRLDGEPAEGVTVAQGGTVKRWLTGADGRVVCEIDRSVEGDHALIASHPDARTEAAMAWDDTAEVTIDLDRYDPTDNEAYLFQDPGDPGHSPTSAQCGHCHVTIAEDFFDSRHPWTTSNPAVQDLYAGASAALAAQEACEAAGGRWWTGLIPGSGAAGERCYLGDGVLPTLNEGCGETAPCDGVATKFGACADCHAAGIDGALGGRDLLEASGFAYERGIHCDVCHHVESIDPDAPAGVAGRLKMMRPSDPGLTPSFGDWRPLLFGPHDDVPNPFMGIVTRLVYQESDFCSGCHQLDQEVLVPGQTIDATRWPSGRLPVHSTSAEWKAAGIGFTCQGCHMPGDPDVANTADLQLFPSTVGVAGGWHRPPPSVRRHIWYGPRSTDSPIRATAASVELGKEVADDVLTVTATTRNSAAGHGLPSGEPMRSVLLLVEASCGDEPLVATGGDAVPDFGGYLAMKLAGEDWTSWPGATVGEVVRVVVRPGGHYDYTGFGPFGDGTFDAAAKGMPVEEVVGQARIVQVDGDLVTFDTPLPAGDVAYRTADGGLPGAGDAALGRAGAPGFGFARIMVGPDGRRQVPHFLAVDVASDNRLTYKQLLQ